MDSDHFASLTRSLTGARARRRAVAAMLGASLGLLGRAHPDATAAKKRKKRKSCPPCKKRKQGRCTGKKRDGTTCPLPDAAGTCQRGRCVVSVTPPPPGPPPPPLTVECPGLACDAVCCTPPPGLVVAGVACGRPPAPLCTCTVRAADVCALGCTDQDPFTVDCTTFSDDFVPDLCELAGCEPPLAR